MRNDPMLATPAEHELDLGPGHDLDGVGGKTPSRRRIAGQGRRCRQLRGEVGGVLAGARSDSSTVLESLKTRLRTARIGSRLRTQASG